MVDLLMLEHTLGALPVTAWEKARGAYGPSVDRAWDGALRRMCARPDLVARVFDSSIKSTGLPSDSEPPPPCP